MTNENIDLVRRMDFDRLDALVSERIGALKLYAESIGKAGADVEAHDAICRDLILPAVGVLMHFLESVQIGESE